MKRIILAIACVIAVASMNAQIINVYKDGNLVKSYSADEADCVEFVESSTPEPATHESVDLGLPSGTLWATCNVGASKPEEYGDYFAWGEVYGFNRGKTCYDWTTYKFCDGTSNTLTKYCAEIRYGDTDRKMELESDDDAATVAWGSEWQTPSLDQMKELCDTTYTSSEWTTLNGVYGRLVTSKVEGYTDKSIFLPHGGMIHGTQFFSVDNIGSYWSRSINQDASNEAYYLYFHSSHFGTNKTYRFEGRTVRPVRVQE